MRWACMFSKRCTSTGCVTGVWGLFLLAKALQGVEHLSRLAWAQIHQRDIVITETLTGRPCPCYTEKAPNAWHRRGTQKTGNTYNQPNQPNRHTSQTKHYRKDSPGDA